MTLQFQANKDVSVGLGDLDVAFEALTEVVFGDSTIEPPFTTCWFGGIIAPPVEHDNDGFVNANALDGSLVFNVLDLIAGTAIQVDDIEAIAIVTWNGVDSEQWEHLPFNAETPTINFTPLGGTLLIADGVVLFGAEDDFLGVSEFADEGAWNRFVSWVDCGECTSCLYEEEPIYAPFELQYDVSSGTHATVTGFVGTIPNELEIPDSVTINGTIYSVTHIGDSAFKGAEITSVTLPYGITHISHFAFSETQLESVYIPGSVIDIGWAAFGDTPLVSVVFGEGTPVYDDFCELTIGMAAFVNTVNLTSINVPEYANVELAAFLGSGIEWMFETNALFKAFSVQMCRRCANTSSAAFRLGDINGDGEITVVDALQILRYIVGLSSMVNCCATSRQAALISNQNSPAVRCALEILRYVVGLQSILQPLGSKPKPKDSLRPPPSELIVTEAQLIELGWHNITKALILDLNQTLEIYEINTPARIRHFISQSAHESSGGMFALEVANGMAYESRADLGNVNPGDGPKFKGAGFIQLTGRYNYQRFADYMNDPEIVNQGAVYVAANYPWRSAGFWWNNNNMNTRIDGGYTVEQVTRRVNGGLRGLAERKRWYNLTAEIFQ
jgi:predicted chitinase